MDAPTNARSRPKTMSNIGFVPVRGRLVPRATCAPNTASGGPAGEEDDDTAITPDELEMLESSTPLLLIVESELELESSMRFPRRVAHGRLRALAALAVSASVRRFRSVRG
jgi:hypothetical protein